MTGEPEHGMRWLINPRTKSDDSQGHTLHVMKGGLSLA
jgi:hypothetical protein